MTLRHSDSYEKLRGEFYREYLMKKGTGEEFYLRGVAFKIQFNVGNNERKENYISGKFKGDFTWLADITDVSEAASMAIDVVMSMGLLNEGEAKDGQG